jgi:hypothetical protein
VHAAQEVQVAQEVHAAQEVQVAQEMHAAQEMQVAQEEHAAQKVQGAQELHEPTLGGWPGQSLHATRSTAWAPQWQFVHHACLKIPHAGSVQATFGALKFRLGGA